MDTHKNLTNSKTRPLVKDKKHWSSKLCHKKIKVTSQPSFPSYLDYAPDPIQVNYTSRAVTLNSTPSMFLSGEMHPVRGTKSMWRNALKHAVESNLNMISLYTFWSYHQPFLNSSISFELPSSNDEEEWNLARAIQEAGCHGLFVYLRIGPYVCAEFNYGGIPEWVPLQENVTMRRYNKQWMVLMQTWLEALSQYITDHKLWADQGGPIILAQIENELGANKNENLEDIQRYAEWCGELASSSLNPNIVWTMCQGVTSTKTIETCNGYEYNGGCSTYWLTNKGATSKIQVTQPAIWTENENGFQIWGDDPSQPSVYFSRRSGKSLAKDVMQFYARGGNVMNYYMFWGGYNFNRNPSAGITNAYATEALVCPNALDVNHPRFAHMQKLHKILASISVSLMLEKSAVDQLDFLEYFFEEEYKWILSPKIKTFSYNKKQVIFIENHRQDESHVRVSFTNKEEYLEFNIPAFSSILILNGTLAFVSDNTHQKAFQYERKFYDLNVSLEWYTWSEPIGARSSSNEKKIISLAPIEQNYLMMKTNTYSDFAWYETDLEIKRDLYNSTIVLNGQISNSLHIYLNEIFLGYRENHQYGQGVITYSIPAGNIMKGSYKLSIFSISFGNLNIIGRWGIDSKAKLKGIDGNITLTSKRSLEDDKREEIMVLHKRKYTWVSQSGPNSISEPLTTTSKDLIIEWDNMRNCLSSCIMKPNTFAFTKFFVSDQALNSSSLVLDVASLGHGKIWLNGYDLGRYWNMTQGNAQRYCQRYFLLPTDYLYFSNKKDEYKRMNEIVIYSAVGADLVNAKLLLTKVSKRYGNEVSEGNDRLHCI